MRDGTGPTLQELVQEVLDSGVSQNEIVRRAGGKITRPTLVKIVKAGHVPTRDGVLAALAEGLGRSRRSVEMAARRQGPSRAYVTDILELAGLSEENREAVRALAAALLTSQRKIEQLEVEIAGAKAKADEVDRLADRLFPEDEDTEEPRPGRRAG